MEDRCFEPEPRSRLAEEPAAGAPCRWPERRPFGVAAIRGRVLGQTLRVGITVRIGEADGVPVGRRASLHELAALDKLGFVVVPELLPVREVDLLTAEFERLVAGDPEAMCHELGTRRTKASNDNAVFALCWRHAVVLDAASHVLGPTSRSGTSACGTRVLDTASSVSTPTTVQLPRDHRYLVPGRVHCRERRDPRPARLTPVTASKFRDSDPGHRSSGPWRGRCHGPAGVSPTARRAPVPRCRSQHDRLSAPRRPPLLSTSHSRARLAPHGPSHRRSSVTARPSRPRPDLTFRRDASVRQNVGPCP